MELFASAALLIPANSLVVEVSKKQAKDFYNELQHKIVAKGHQSTLKEGTNSRLLFLTHQFVL